MSTPITSKDTPKMTSSPAANMPSQAHGTLPSTDQTALLQSDVGGPTLSTPAHTGMGQTHIPIDITAPSGAESVAAVRKDHPRKIPTVIPPSQAPPELTYADSLYTTATIFSAFASAVTFGAILYFAIHNIGPVFNTYLAFAYLFLIFAHFQTLGMVYGFAKSPDQRKMVNQSSMGLAWFNIILGIIAVVTFAVRQDDYPVNNTPYACLIIGIILEFFAFIFQLAGQRHISTLPRDNSNYYFPPLTFQTKTITGLLVLNPLLCVLTFSFALGAVVNANGLAEIASQQTQAAAAFACLFFITGTIGAIIAVLTIVPGPSVEPLVATSWVFSLLNFLFSFLAFILLFAQGVSNHVAAFWFLAWIISLFSFAVSLSAWLLLGGRTGEYCCRCDDLGAEITRQRNIVELEKARLEAAIVRKERETLELAQT